jgi:hypothetical protein
MDMKTEVINFKDFMNGNYKKEKKPVKKYSIHYSFIPMNPMAFIDPIFFTFAGCMVAVALIERHFEQKEKYTELKYMRLTRNIILPCAGIGGLIYFGNSLGRFL